MPLNRIVYLLPGLLAGCVTLAPEAESLRVTRDGAEVAGCKILGTVEGHPPYIGPNDAMNQLRNQAAAQGGNVLLVTSFSFTVTGVSYRCDRSEPTAP